MNKIMENMRQFLIIISMALIPGTLIAGGYNHFGARALGMAGAFTAVADDASSVYWNPAGIAIMNKSYFHGMYGYRQENHRNAKEILNKLIDQGLINSDGSGSDSDQLSKLLKKLDRKGVGMERVENLNFILAGPEMAISSMGYDIGYLDPHVPGINNDDLLPTPADKPRLRFTGLKVIEWTLTTAYLNEKNFYSAGINFKYIEARTFYHEVPLKNLLSSDEIGLYEESFETSSRKERKYTFDMGYIMFLKTGRFAVVTKNLWENSIKFPDGHKKVMEGTIRVGYAYMPNDSFTLAIDIDVLEQKNKDIGYKSREFAIGLEKGFGKQKIFLIRFGAMKNLSERDDNFVYAGGIGFSTKYLKFDVGYVTDTDYDDETLQVEVAVSF